MSTSQLEHLRLLKAHLESLLETASKRTSGRWESKNGGELLRNINSGDQVICTVAMRRGSGNLPFIASCAGNAEAGWKSTLVAVDDWLSLYNSTEGYADGAPDASTHDRLCNEVSSICRINLGHILAEWPIETLKP